MKRIVSVLLSVIFFSISFSRPILAQNKCGVNVGPYYNQADQVASFTKSGGWVVALGTLGNCSGFESLFGKGLNVVIRAYNGGKTFTNDEGLAWVATLGKLDTKGQKVYFMPWNEPNHAGNEGGGDNWGDKVLEYSLFLKNKLIEAGLLNTKVILLSPMVDKANDTFIKNTFFTNPGGRSGFYSHFSGSSINEYDQFSPGPCSAIPEQNNCLYDQIGIPGSFYSLETGVAGTAIPPRYKDSELRQMLDASWPKWKSDGNFNMFAIFSYDPHRGGWDIFTSSQTRNFYQKSCSAGGITTGQFDPKQTFDQWFANNEDELVNCSNTCGYAPKGNPSLCSGVSGGSYNRKPFIPSRKETTNDTTRSISDTVLLSQQSEEIATGAIVRKNVTKGGFFREFQDLTIPFAKDLTEYLAGPYVYQYNSYIKEIVDERNPIKFRPLANLSPRRYQDELRYNYWKNCLESIYCSSKNIGSLQCPSKENNECLSSDGKREFQEFCPPPYSAFTKLPNFPSFCPKSEDDWLTSWGALWSEIPLIANPKTEVKNSILMNTCPAPSMITTTTLTKTPWISALKEVSATINRLYTSYGESGFTSLPPQMAKSAPKLLASADLLAEAYSGPTVRIPIVLDPGQPPVNGEYTIGWRVCAGEKGLHGGCPLNHYNLAISGSSDNGAVSGGGTIVSEHGPDGRLTVGQCFTTGNNNVPPFKVKANVGDKFSLTATITGTANCTGQKATVSETCTTTFTADGWTICVPGTPFGGGIIEPPKCYPPETPKFVSPGEKFDSVEAEGHTLLKEDRYIGCGEWQLVGSELQCKKLQDQLKYTINDPTWAEVEYPYLGTIFDNLTGFDGLFIRLFKPSQVEYDNWDYAAESNITYCLKDHPASAMIKGGTLEIDKRTFISPGARCDDSLYTREIRAFPSYLGGIYNAKEWVKERLLRSKYQ